MKIDFLIWFFSGIACYRLTVLITRCLGPYDFFKKLRSIDRCSKLLKCPMCVSVYMGGFVSLVLWCSGFTMPIGMWFLISLSFSGISIALDRCFTADIQN